MAPDKNTRSKRKGSTSSKKAAVRLDRAKAISPSEAAAVRGGKFTPEIVRNKPGDNS
jgi:hypothetical protein